MLNLIPEFLKGINIIDLVDIATVSMILYWILLRIKGTRAIQMLFGLIVLGGGYILAQRVNLNTLEWILENFLGSIVIVIVVLFQDEIRRGLALVGTNPLTGMNPGEQKHIIDELVKASTMLSGRRIGALIAVERSTGLKNYIEKGAPVGGVLSQDLLLSIFMPFSPIHDGAVIISDGRIAAARCLLPLTSNPRLEKILGTRHRAALGLTEETDAVAIIVSEETGRVSAACEGKLYSRLETEELRRILERLLSGEGTRIKGSWWERMKVAIRTAKKPAA
jgi:diadenylate cyclase